MTLCFYHKALVYFLTEVKMLIVCMTTVYILITLDVNKRFRTDGIVRSMLMIDFAFYATTEFGIKGINQTCSWLVKKRHIVSQFG